MREEEPAKTGRDGFPHNLAVWMGFAFAFALSLFTAFAFGGFPVP